MTDEARRVVEMEYQYGGIIVQRFSDGTVEYIGREVSDDH